jgi:hypothetical protein
MADTRKGTGAGTAVKRDDVLEGEAVPARLEGLDEPRGRAGDEEADDDAVEMDEADEEDEDADEDEADEEDEDADEEDDEDEDDEEDEEDEEDEAEER